MAGHRAGDGFRTGQDGNRIGGHQRRQRGIIAVKPAGIGPVGGHDDALRVDQETGAGCAAKPHFRMVVTRNLGGLPGCDVAAGHGAKRHVAPVAAAERVGACIMVAHHPCPVAACHQADERHLVAVIKHGGSGQIVEGITKGDQ
jgi:hypothetical protein